MLSILTALMVSAVALGPRLSALWRELWYDEAWQAINVVTAENLASLIGKVSIHATPLLDFLLLKWLWDPLLGHQELALRLPSLFCGLLAVALASLFAFHRIRAQAALPVATLAALIAGLWCAESSSQIYYSVEARTYSFAALASLVWAAAWILFREGRPWRVAVASGFFLQAHFFAIPLIVAAYGYDAVADLFARRPRRAAQGLVVCAALVAATLALSWGPFSKLLTFGRWAGATAAVPFSQRLTTGMALYRDYLQTLELPWGAAVWVALAVCGALVSPPPGRAAARRLAWLLLAILPAEYAMLRVSSGYYFSTRYHLPFFGIGLAVLVLGLEAVVSLAARIPAPTEVSLVALALPAVLLARVTATRPALWSLPAHSNYTGNYHLFESLKDGHPAFLLTSCGGVMVPQMYLDIIGRARPASLTAVTLAGEIADWRAQTGEGSALEEFLRTHPRAPVVLFQALSTCPSAPHVSDLNLDVIRYDLGMNCAWAIRGARHAAEIRRLAETERFPAHLNFTPFCHH